MNSENPPETIRDNFIGFMGGDLGSVYYKLYNQVIFLHQRWITYLELFATEKPRIELLNKSGSYFFYIVQKGLFENVIMSIARITDPEKTNNKLKNLSLHLLPYLIHDGGLKNEIELQLKWHIKPTVLFARELRNKRFGHEDFDISMGVSFLQEKSGIEEVEMALKAIRNLMNTIQVHFKDGKTIYKDGGSNRSTLLMLKTLEDGVNASDYLDYLLIKGEEPNEILKKKHITYDVRHIEFD